MNFLDDISLDKCETTCITEGYTESAYQFFADGGLPNFYLPPSASWYAKAALRERFPGMVLPSVLQIENMLIDLGLMPPRDLAGYKLLPQFHQWPPRQRRPRVGSD